MTATSRSAAGSCPVSVSISAADDSWPTRLSWEVCALLQRRSTLLSMGVRLPVVMAEAIVVVATFQLAHNPYRMAIPLLQTPEEYNDIVCSTMLSAHHHDQGMFSEPCALMQLYKSWLGSHSRDQWARTNCVASTRMRQLDTIVRHLTERVSKVRRLGAIVHRSVCCNSRLLL